MTISLTFPLTAIPKRFRLTIRGRAHPWGRGPSAQAGLTGYSPAGTRLRRWGSGQKTTPLKTAKNPLWAIPDPFPDPRPQFRARTPSGDTEPEALLLPPDREGICSTTTECSSRLVFLQAAVPRLFVLMKASTVLNTFRNRGVPANDRGLTGPMVIKLYCREAMSKELCGSRKRR
jgi:hypothetical protein